MQYSMPAPKPTNEQDKPTLDDILRELNVKLDSITADIDVKNNNKDYLNTRIKELNAKITEIDKLVGDYEKEFNNTMEKDAELQGYIERKKPSVDEIGKHRIEEIEKILNEKISKDVSDAKEHLKDLIKGNPDKKIKSLQEYKNDLWEAQNKLTIKQKIYDDFKTQLKDRQKEFTTQSKKLDDFKNSVDTYFKDREHKLAELYFSIEETESFSKDLHEDFEKPGHIREVLENYCKAIIDAMKSVSTAEESLKNIQSEIDACKKKLTWLETRRLTYILDKIAKLGTCIETSTDPETSTDCETYE